ncbi:hypothetical protein HQ487_01090 [Candidatus Uhrbacteria bacterium]|nr:hypothetical protein [Candidatus Uhrbacteria bacterium]
MLSEFFPFHIQGVKMPSADAVPTLADLADPDPEVRVRVTSHLIYMISTSGFCTRARERMPDSGISLFRTRRLPCRVGVKILRGAGLQGQVVFCLFVHANGLITVNGERVGTCEDESHVLALLNTTLDRYAPPVQN